MKLKLNDDYKIIGFREGRIIALISTPKKSEDGLIHFNSRPIWKRILFREPDIIELRYIKKEKGGKKK